MIQKFLKSRGRISLLSLAGFVLVCWGISLWINYSPFKKYGVTYTVDSGEHVEYNFLTLHWDRGGKHIEGPTIIGNYLALKPIYDDANATPNIMVCTDLREPRDYLILKLNFNDSSKPEFELIKSVGYLGIRYPAPWENYYKLNSNISPISGERPIQIDNAAAAIK